MARAGGRVGRQAGGNERVVAGDQGLAQRGCLRRLALLAGLVGGRFHLPQEPLELSGPALLILLFQEVQLAQMMNVAQRVAALGVGLVGLPAVMHAHAGVGRQDADGVGRLTGRAWDG